MLTADFISALWEILPYMLGCLTLFILDTFDRWRHPNA